MTTKKKKRRCYLKWFETWGRLELNAILFHSWSKPRSNSKLPSTIVTNIPRSSPYTTSWFIEVRHQHLKTNLEDLKSHMHISIVSKSNLKLQVFGLFSRFFALWSLKYPHPKSHQTPRVSTELWMVVNLSYSFIPLQKNMTKGVDRPVENPRKRAKNIQIAPNALNKLY